MDFLQLMNSYIKSELLIITPVLYIIAKMMDNSHMDSKKIPWYLLLISIILSTLYTFANVDVSTRSLFMMAVFTSFVQGVLLAGTTVFGGILASLMKNKKK
ncbi:phage holin family protein [Amedibacillus sp. YH-ame10]